MYILECLVEVKWQLTHNIILSQKETLIGNSLKKNEIIGVEILPTELLIVHTFYWGALEDRTRVQGGGPKIPIYA